MREAVFDSIGRFVQKNIRRLFLGVPQRLESMVEEFYYRLGMVHVGA